MDDFQPDRPAYGSLSATPPPAPAPSRGGSLWPWLLMLAFVAFAVGLVISPWFETEVRSRLFGAKPDRTAILATESTSQARTIVALQRRVAELERAAGEGGSDPERLARAEQRVAELQTQIGALGARVEGAVNGAAHDALTAQGVLLAAATRRAVEAGQPLGALEPPLRARYGQSYPGPVEALVAAGAHPITLARLRQDFARLRPALASEPGRSDDWWTSLKSAIGGVVAVRRAGDVRVDPEQQAGVAAQLLDSGDVAGAAAIVIRLPGSRAAANWLADARRYRAAQAALAQLEAAALAPAAVTPAVAAAPVPLPAPAPSLR